MPEPTLLPERIFGLSAVDGRRSVRARRGRLVPLPRQKRGRGDAAPLARVLVLPPGWSAVDPLEADIPPVAPGDRAHVPSGLVPTSPTRRPRIHRSRQRSTSTRSVLGSNVVRMRVLRASASRRPGERHADRAHSRRQPAHHATVVNEGDAAASYVRVVVPPPPGFAAGTAPTTAARPELAVGETLSIAYEATPIGSVAAGVGIDDASVTYDGGRAGATDRWPVRLLPKLVPPAVTCRRRAGTPRSAGSRRERRLGPGARDRTRPRIAGRLAHRARQRSKPAAPRRRCVATPHRKTAWRSRSRSFPRAAPSR